MAVSKRLRFEVLRRDNHTCRYCGASAPDVKLAVDHVKPEALGGKSEPENLVTACEPCNSGKTSVAPGSDLVAGVEADALRWARAIAVAAAKMLDDQAERRAQSDAFEARWNAWTVAGQPLELPASWRHSVDRFIAAGLPLPILLGCLDKSMGNEKIRRDDKFRYMCGIGWKLVDELHQAARAQLDDRRGAPGGEPAVANDLVEYIYEQGTSNEIERWEQEGLKSLGEGEPVPDAAGQRILTAHAAVDEWVYELWRHSDTVALLVARNYLDEAIEAARAWTVSQLDENMPDGGYTDYDMDIMVARRLALQTTPADVVAAEAARAAEAAGSE